MTSKASIDTCPHCRGRGWEAVDPFDAWKPADQRAGALRCAWCGGSGERSVMAQEAPK